MQSQQVAAQSAVFEEPSQLISGTWCTADLYLVPLPAKMKSITLAWILVPKIKSIILAWILVPKIKSITLAWILVPVSDL
jgi:hypothetical protein